MEVVKEKKLSMKFTLDLLVEFKSYALKMEEYISSLANTLVSWYAFYPPLEVYDKKKMGLQSLICPISHAGVFGAPRICPDNERIYVEQMSSISVQSSM